MKTQMNLWLTSSQLQFEVARVSSHGPWGALRALPRRSRSQTLLSGGTTAGSTFSWTQGDLQSCLEHAFAELAASHRESLAGADLAVRLGTSHAHVGIMHLEGKAHTAINFDTQKVYIAAWVRQMLHEDPSTQIIRWQGLADPHELMVSCVESEVFQQLESFCTKTGLRFQSCRPAILDAVATVQASVNQRDPSDWTTVAWTEAVAGRRASVVQLLGFNRGRLRAIWRGWVPASSRCDGPDVSLQSAVLRFEAHNSFAASRRSFQEIRWPAAPAQADVFQVAA